LVDGIRWRERVGAPWRDVPERYGHWQSIYALFRSWQRAGVWRRIWITLLGFADTAGLICWQLSVDSTINRAHQHAAGARHHPEDQVQPPGAEPPDHGLGRSRGGLTTKIHLACEQGRGPMSVLITAGQRADCPQFVRVLQRVRVPRPLGGQVHRLLFGLLRLLGRHAAPPVGTKTPMPGARPLAARGLDKQGCNLDAAARSAAGVMEAPGRTKSTEIIPRSPIPEFRRAVRHGPC